MSGVDAGIGAAEGIITTAIPLTAAIGVIGMVSRMGQMATQPQGYYCRDCGIRHPNRKVIEDHVRKEHGRDPNAGQLTKAQQRSGSRDITDSSGWLSGMKF